MDLVKLVLIAAILTLLLFPNRREGFAPANVSAPSRFNHQLAEISQRGGQHPPGFWLPGPGNPMPLYHGVHEMLASDPKSCPVGLNQYYSPGFIDTSLPMPTPATDVPTSDVPGQTEGAGGMPLPEFDNPILTDHHVTADARTGYLTPGPTSERCTAMTGSSLGCQLPAPVSGRMA